MPLLTTALYRDRLLSALRNADSRVYIASAYITVEGIEALLGAIHPTLPEVKVLARWDSRDLVSGASDLEVYERLRGRGFALFVEQTLHAKFVLIDDALLFLGSANITASGLQLEIKGNWEGGTTTVPDTEDLETIKRLFSNSTLMTDPLYLEIKDFVLQLRSKFEPPTLLFPASIAHQLQPAVKGLWVRDLPWTENPEKLDSTDPNGAHDLMMLGTKNAAVSKAYIRKAFQESACCRWLRSALEEHDGELYFGEASSILHNALLEDPKPYRKTVKVLLSNLFNWASIAIPDLFVLDSPQHSQRIRLLR